MLEIYGTARKWVPFGTENSGIDRLGPVSIKYHVKVSPKRIFEDPHKVTQSKNRYELASFYREEDPMRSPVSQECWF